MCARKRLMTRELRREYMTRERMKAVLEELLDPDNWKPNLSKIANKLDIPVSTVFDNTKYILENDIVTFHTDITLNIRRKKNGRKKDSVR
jgi:hypothetical protein